ncbi:unnamed protein product [Litomosoides sigmodontis]|uniref:Uncharacterized protein n=1 Tax=Litomosoides sigmodontis TaxID=42156 RepID=A0A3P6S3Q3_LITSI|nr:unnamed protein product [Litomosoides sigmodontis]
MDEAVHTAFCMPFKQRSNHAAKPGDEGGVPAKPLSLPSQPHSSRLDNTNESSSRSCATMDFPPPKLDAFATFLSSKFYFSCKFVVNLLYASQRSEVPSDNQINPAKVPLSVSQSMVISRDNSKSFLLKSVSPYVQQTITTPKTLSEVIQPPAPSSAHLISASLTTNQTLPLPHCSFSVPTTNALSQNPHFDCRTDDSLCRNRDPLLIKEPIHEGHCCENAPSRLRLKTTDGSCAGLRSTYGRSGWHASIRHSTLPYADSGASRCYTKPSPSLPLLPLGQACGRSAPRRFILSSFPESYCYESEPFGEQSGLRSNKEGNEQAYNSCYVGNLPSVSTSPITQSTYGGANITYTAAGTAPPPKTSSLHSWKYKGDPNQVVICSSTTSGRTVTYPYPSKSTYTYAECDTDHSRPSHGEGMCKSSMHNNGKYSKRAYSTSIARPPTTAINPSLKKKSDQTIHGQANKQTNLAEEYQQNSKEEKNTVRPAGSISTFSKCLNRG